MSAESLDSEANLPIRGGAFLKSIRNINGLTAQRAAARSGLGKSYLSLLESDSIKDPGISKIPAIALAYGITVESVLAAYGIELQSASEVIDTEKIAMAEALVNLDAADRVSVTKFAGYLASQQNAPDK